MMPRTASVFHAPAALSLPLALCAALLLGSATEAAAQAGGMNAVTKCQGGGRTSYSQDGRCPPGMESVEITRPALSQADAVPVPPPQTAASAAPAAAKPATGRAAPGKAAASSSGSYAAEARRKRAQRCEALARQLRLVDERAAQPLSAAAQDRLREQRRRMQQEQTEARCP
jgi:hypothetical protein